MRRPLTETEQHLFGLIAKHPELETTLSNSGMMPFQMEPDTDRWKIAQAIICAYMVGFKVGRREVVTDIAEQLRRQPTATP